MKNLIVIAIASSFAFSTASFACSGHKHQHKPATKPTTEQIKK